MTDRDALRRRWTLTCSRCPTPTTDEADRERLFDEILSRYSEEARAYHTTEHLGEVFGLLDESGVIVDDALGLELALWFHDVIYDPRARDNEEQSAAWADEQLERWRLSPVLRERVTELILVTRHDGLPRDEDARLLVDVDLGILGAETERFEAYEEQVRREYAWVPEADYRRGRAAILRSFLDRTSIYGTAWFRSEREERARTNLERSLARLG